ncbi:MAG: hypothetical protein KAT30_00490, partial [Candidatus Krumholzibacteria bacterium]|nr:hypothetical protein [Candidatus Krumholzibacteria bacterium]
MKIRRVNEPRILLATDDSDLAARLGRELRRTGIAMDLWQPGDTAPAQPAEGYHIVVADSDAGTDFVEQTVGTARAASTALAVVALAEDPSREQLLRLLS